VKGPGLIRMQLLGSEVPFNKKDSKDPVSPFLRFLKFDHGRCAGSGSLVLDQNPGQYVGVFRILNRMNLVSYMCGLKATSLDRPGAVQ